MLNVIQPTGNIRTMRAVLLLLLSMVPVLTHHAAGEEASIISNGGFEAGRNGWWGDGTQSEHSPAAGRASLKVEAGFAAQDKIVVQERTRYRLSAFVRSDSAAPESVSVQMSFRGNKVDRGWRGAATIEVEGREEPAILVTGGTHGWKRFSAVVEAPAGATQLVVYLRKARGSSGSTYFDEVTLVKTAEPVTSQEQWLREHLGAKSIAASRAAFEELSQRRSSEANETLDLVRGGVALSGLMTGAGEDVVVLNAVLELSRGLRKISGADFSGSTDPESSGPLIVIGRNNPLFEKFCPDVDFSSLGEDGFVIRTVGSRLFIAGATSRGTMYGVYWFLDRKLGVKWLSPKVAYFPQTRDLATSQVDETHVPRFSYREVLSHEGQDKRFRAHNLLNGESHGPSFSKGPPAIDSWNRSWLAKGGVANFFQLVPKAKYASAHPDWYTGGQVSMMNSELRKVTAENIVKRLKAHPSYKDIWFGVHDMDWGWDMDPSSAAFASKHGNKPSAPRLDMMIDVASQVRKALPDARLAFNAYHWSFTPPDSMSVPDHILVYPMTVHVDYSSPLFSGRNEQLGKDIVRWNEIAKNVLVWDHIVNFAGFLQPTPNIYPIGESIKWLAGLPNVKGYFAEGSWNTPGAEFASLRVWLISRLLWEPELDVAGLVREYCDAYYGAAGKKVNAYIDLMHSQIRRSGDLLSEKTQVDVAMFTPEFLIQADHLLREAEEQVKHEKSLVERVRAVRASIDYVVLLRRAEYVDEARRQNLTWEPDFPARLERLKGVLSAQGVRQYRQGGSVAELMDLLKIERKPSDVVRAPGALQDAAVHFFQDLSLNRYGKTPIVADEAASDGAAVKIDGKFSMWAVQFKLWKLPPAGTWDLYARVRVEAEPALDDQEGVIVGSYPPMTLSKKEKNGSLRDGNYHLVKVPGGPFKFHPDMNFGVYVAPVGGRVGAIYVDGLMAMQSR